MNCMRRVRSIRRNAGWFSIALALAIGMARLAAQAPGGGRTAQALFTALDANGDGSLAQSEMEAGFNSWFKSWNTANNGTLTRDQVAAGLTNVLPAPPAAKPGQGNTFNINGNSTPMTAPQPAV